MKESFNFIHVILKLIIFAQFIFIITYAIIYLISQTADYFEEEAVISYTEFMS